MAWAARFEVGDVLRLSDLGPAFDTVIDSGVFHTFDDDGRLRYVASLASVLRRAVCFSWSASATVSRGFGAAAG